VVEALAGHNDEPAADYPRPVCLPARRFLLPTFGKAALSSIDVLAVRAWLARLQEQGVSASTRAKAYRLLSRILGAAVEAGYLLRNPCTVRGAGQERAPEMRFATVAQVAALADAIGPRYRALVLVAAYGGLRWGELAGLCGKRVDPLHGRVTVAEQVAEVNGQLIPGPPKTEAGRRTVTLPAVAAAALAEHLAEFAEPGPEGWSSRLRRAAVCAAPTSAAAGGSEQPARPGWKGCGSMTCATRPRPSPWRLGRIPVS
jgi:integrase